MLSSLRRPAHLCGLWATGLQAIQQWHKRNRRVAQSKLPYMEEELLKTARGALTVAKKGKHEAGGAIASEQGFEKLPSMGIPGGGEWRQQVDCTW
ncbi:hypothetical protein OE88DRAFT_1662248 [Heliocybe sulcata]|uniref:Uncharacterized protein n=1 Tax=Heliocybe sulcata TaxID=5364 RepID=A0A5C3MZN0_9AGAM|nr:hypothetical protein OE88DRAFT_1662248 [Heliocybe sulcata]